MWMQDFRLASRTLRRSPGFTIIAILILGIGIGGIASSFTIVDGFLLTPLPFDDPEHLVHLYRTDPQGGGTEGRFALPMIAAMRNGTDSLVDLGAYQYGGRNLADDSGDPQHLMVGTLTTNVLGILGIEPAFGRGFAPQDGLDGAERVVLLDQGLWRNRFGGRTEVLGTRLELDGEPHTVIGVMRGRFHLPLRRSEAVGAALTRLPERFLDVRELPAGGTVGSRRRSRGSERGDADSLPETARERTGTVPDYGVSAVPLRRALLFLYDLIQVVLLLALVANAFVLLIICANVANLMIARATGRTREMAMRSVLGAQRHQLVHQVLCEGLLLAAAGSLLGLGIVAWQAASFDQMLPEALFRAGPLALNPRVLVFTVVVTALSVIAFALTPALQVSRVDLGFEPDGVLTMGVHLDQKSYPEKRDVLAFQKGVVDAVTALPGVEGAAFVEPLCP